MAMAAEETNNPETKQPATKKPEKEGANLLGRPKFTKLPNGRFKCVQTGHELLAKDKESYSQSKRCRLGLIDYALSNGKAPLNMFDQDPDSRSKLICKLTGDKVNKSEEHIWKHMSGKRFLIKLEQEEEERKGDGFDIVTLEEAAKDSSKKKKKKKDKNKKGKDKEKEKGKEKITNEADSEAVEGSVKNRNSDEEEFWMPPDGERWDFDDGGDRWGSDDESEQENEDETLEEDGSVEDGSTKSEEIPTKKKRKSVEVGADDSASKKRRKKKKKKKSKKNAKNTSSA